MNRRAYLMALATWLATIIMLDANGVRVTAVAYLLGVAACLLFGMFSNDRQGRR